VQRGERLLGDGLDRDGSDVLVAAGLEDALGVGLVGLVAFDVGADLVWREQDHLVSELLKAACPVVGRAAGLHHHDRRRLLGEEGEELLAPEAFGARDSARVVGDRDLEDGLCDVDGDASNVLHDGLLLIASQQRLWHIDAD